ncbi:exosortase T [Tropicimonas sp.]|uniref:exosortase T n=1 Tax=Tropicimonas sp. TaxID=2067044 RepID=UPI003A8524CC
MPIRPAPLLFAAASATLAWHPVLWLANSWTDAAYDSSGFVFAIAIVALVLRSLASGPARPGGSGALVCLLLSAAGLRFLSQTLAINIVGGAALAVDVAALALLARVDRRPLALSPLWLAVLFLFSLPLEAVLERLLGFPLQMISARLSCGLLGLIHDGTSCEGIRIGIAGQDVLVDLPCAGAAGLMLLMAFLAGLNAVQRPAPATALLRGVIALGLAVAGNSLRIALLAMGLVHGFDVMAEPAHSLIGLATLALAAAPLAFLGRPHPGSATRAGSPSWHLPAALHLPGGLACLGLALWIVTQPARPVDISHPVAPAPLPASLGGHAGVPVALSRLEERYFRAYGGAAAKVQYGPFGINRVQTTSPLRHLHSPEDCLRGLGYRVAFLGTRHAGAPSSVYRATAPDGRTWQVAVTYVAPDGRMVPSVAEAVWLWLGGRSGTWTSLQRITPAGLDAPARGAMEAAIFAALDIPIINKEPTS